MVLAASPWLVALAHCSGSPLAFSAFTVAELFTLVAVGGLYARASVSRVASVCADAEGLWLDGRLVRRRGIASASVHARSDGYWVRLDATASEADAKLGLIEIRVDDAREGDEIISAMHLSPGESVGAFVFTNGSGKRALARRLYGLGLVAAQSAWGVEFASSRIAESTSLLLLDLALVGPTIVLGAVGYFLLGPWFVRLKVGADGVEIRRDFGTRRFVPFGEIQSVELEGNELVLRASRRELVRAACAGRGMSALTTLDSGRPGELAAAFISRLRERVDNANSSHTERLRLRRGAQSARAWVATLASVARDPESYRQAQIPTDVLWQVVEDARAMRTERAGAAIALRASLDDAGRVRLRVTAETCADTRLRVALTRAASNASDEDALVDAIGSFEDETVARAMAERDAP